MASYSVCHVPVFCPIHPSVRASRQLTWWRNQFFGNFTGIVSDSDEEWTGITPSPSGDGDLENDADAERRECEYSYSDEEQLATVTVVEDFDPSALRLPVAPDERQDWASSLAPARREKVKTEGGSGGASKRMDVSAKNNKKVRFETKAARRAAQAKQRARRTEKAERAGGKAARRTKAGGKKRKKISTG